MCVCVYVIYAIQPTNRNTKMVKVACCVQLPALKLTSSLSGSLPYTFGTKNYNGTTKTKSMFMFVISC